MTLQTLGEAGNKVIRTAMQNMDMRGDLGPKEPTGCRYIHGDTKDPDWRYCQETQKPGSSFCEAHHTDCYQKPGSPEHKRDRAIVKRLRDEGKALF